MCVLQGEGQRSRSRISVRRSTRHQRRLRTAQGGYLPHCCGGLVPGDFPRRCWNATLFVTLCALSSVSLLSQGFQGRFLCVSSFKLALNVQRMSMILHAFVDSNDGISSIEWVATTTVPSAACEWPVRDVSLENTGILLLASFQH